jgi:hypothetical protein
VLRSLFLAFVVSCFTKIQIENYNSHVVEIKESVTVLQTQMDTEKIHAQKVTIKSVEIEVSRLIML